MTGRFRILYVFVVLSLSRRRIVYAAVTDPPSAGWAAQSIVEAAGDDLAAPPSAPTGNAFAERVIGTLRRDCFDQIIVKDEQHAERVLRDYVAYYHGRPHRGLRM